MATRVRQTVPSAGPGGRAFGEEYVEDDVAAARLADAGHVVVIATGLTDETVGEQSDAGGPVPDYERMNKAALVALAASFGVADGGTKAEIIARLRAVEETDDGETNAGTAGADDEGGEAGGDGEQPAA